MKYYSPKVEIVHLSANEDILNTSENEKLGNTPDYWADLINGQLSMQ